MKALVNSAFFAIFFVMSVPVMAQMNHSSMHGGGQSSGSAPVATQHGADTSMAEGTVKRVDKTKGTVTLAHGAMNGMPPMTMAYKVKDITWLDNMQVGQKIRFATDPADGGMTVLRFEALK